MTAAAPQTQPTIGRYVLDRRIASGGMAEVYLARQVGPFGFQKSVALKVLRRDLGTDKEHVKMFIREALVAADFKHPNLAQVYEVGEDAGQLFIAMELVRGLALATLLKEVWQRDASVSYAVAVKIGADCLEGLEYAHEARGQDGEPLALVHRDVSPQNVLVGVDGVARRARRRAEVPRGRGRAARAAHPLDLERPQGEPRRPHRAAADAARCVVVART